MAKKIKMDARITLRLPELVCEEWKKAAVASGVCLGDWIRAQVAAEGMDQVVSKKPTPRKAPCLKQRRFAPADPLLIRQVARLGNNLHQIARGINSSGLTELDQFQLLEQLLLVEKQLERLVNSQSLFPGRQGGKDAH